GRVAAQHPDAKTHRYGPSSTARDPFLEAEAPRGPVFEEQVRVVPPTSERDKEQLAAGFFIDFEGTTRRKRSSIACHSDHLGQPRPVWQCLWAPVPAVSLTEGRQAP